MMRPQERHLRFIFYPFGNHLQIEAFRQADDRGCDRRIIGVDGNISNKRPVDFELADPELSQVS